MQHELSKEESDLLKAGLYFSIQPDKIENSEIFTSFEKIYHLFIQGNQKSDKVHLLYLFSTTTNLHI